MEFEKCRDILLEEIKLIRQIAELQNLIYEVVVNRQWTDFEKHFSVLGELKEEFTVLENERESIFEGLKSNSNMDGGFYALVAHFPIEQRNEITEIYRDLKRESLQVQMTGEALMSYISGARATIAGFFEIAFPERKGRIYSSHGNTISHDLRSMVLNQRF